MTLNEFLWLREIREVRHTFCSCVLFLPRLFVHFVRPPPPGRAFRTSPQVSGTLGYQDTGTLGHEDNGCGWGAHYRNRVVIFLFKIQLKIFYF